MLQDISELIDIEREKQTLQWGKQEHTNFCWLAILNEEVGETAQAILQGKAPQTLSEVVQCAAVCIAWLEDWYDSCPDTFYSCKEILERRLALARAETMNGALADTRPAQGG